MAGGGREGDAAAGDTQGSKYGLDSKQFRCCAHHWSPWLGGGAEMRLPEGRHSFRFASELAVVRRCGRGREQASEHVTIGQRACWSAAEQLFCRGAVEATAPVRAHLMSFSAGAGVCVTPLVGALFSAAAAP